MKFLFYLLATISLLFATLSLLRAVEVLAAGGGFLAGQFAFGVIAIVTTMLFASKARRL